MPFHRSEWEQQYGLVRTERGLATAVQDALTKLRTAALPMEKLTGSAEWDSFLRKCAALQEADQAELLSIQEKLASPAYLEDKTLRTLRHSLVRVVGRIEARQQVMDLPKEIVERARELSERK